MSEARGKIKTGSKEKREARATNEGSDLQLYSFNYSDTTIALSMAEEPRTKKCKRTKLSSPEKEKRNHCLENLHETGEFERLQSALYAHLVLRESWLEGMKNRSREAVKKSGGPSEVTLDEMSKALVSEGSATIPSHIEADLKQKIREICF